MFELGLSVVGFLAISAWLMKWARGLHERSKELGEIDKEIRNALKDSVTVQKELYEIERQKFQTQLTHLSEELEKRSTALHAEKETVRAAVRAVDIGGALALKIRNQLLNAEAESIQDHQGKIVELMISTGILSKDKFLRLWKDDIRDAKANGAYLVGEEIAWRLTQILVSHHHIMGGAEAMTLTIPAALNFILQNPSASPEDVGRAVSEAIRKRIGELTGRRDE